MSDSSDDSSAPIPLADICINSAGHSTSSGSSSPGLSVSSSNMSLHDDLGPEANELGTSSTDINISTSFSEDSAASMLLLSQMAPQLPISPYGWYRVLVFNEEGHFSTSEVLDQLSMIVVPYKLKYYFLKEGHEQTDSRASFSFYVDSYSVASDLNRYDEISTNVGIVVSSGWPYIKVDHQYKIKLRSLLLSRYDKNRKCLNLCFIYADYIKLGDYCVLEQPDCMEAVIGTLEIYMPDIRGILLDRNHLKNLDGFRGVEWRLPDLHFVSLRDNNLKTLDTLCSLQYLNITELALAKNPLPRNYERQLINIFPRLKRLDGRMLRRSSSVPTDCARARNQYSARAPLFLKNGRFKLAPPPSKPPPPPPPPPPEVPHLSPRVQQNLRSFMLRYLQAFDGENRKEHLANFYKELVMVTFSLARDQGELSSWAAPYVPFNNQQLTTRQEALEMFALWPQTFHFASTLTFDVVIAQPRMVCLSVAGTFAEHERDGPFKYYMRCLVLLRNSGHIEDDDDFVIANELIYLSSTGTRVPAPSVGELIGQGKPEQKSLISLLTAHTRLNTDWSSSLLYQAKWNYEQAVEAFESSLHRGLIPDNAYLPFAPPGPDPGPEPQSQP